MIAKLFNTAALAAPALAMLALAQPAMANDGASAAAASEAEAPATAARAAPAKYCANIAPDTGSRVSRRICKTKAEWEEEGVEITKKK